MSNAIRKYKTRPDTPQEFEVRASEYFDDMEKEGKAPTILGLVYYTGFPHRQRFNMLRYDANWGDVCQAAVTYICMCYEQRLHSGTCNGAIFALKNIDGWSDRQTFVLENDNNGLEDKPATAIEKHSLQIEAMRKSIQCSTQFVEAEVEVVHEQ